MKHHDPIGPLFSQAPHPKPIPCPLGETFEPERDRERLGAQYCRVRDLMADGAWRSLSEIRAATDYPEASISARLRDMRRDGYTVQRRRRTGVGGTFEYRAEAKE